MMRLFHSAPGLQLYHGDSLAGLPKPCDLLCTDPPYSERCHAGHDAIEGLRCDSAIPYQHWTPGDAFMAAAMWSPFVRGWMVILTDHVLAPHWAQAMEDAGRYVFAPLPFYSPGSRVRLAGDGPSSWTCWIVVSRPRCEPYSKWGTLPGGYVCPPEKMAIVGGKPLRLMHGIISDYSREGDVVCDPCCGSGTTLRAATDLGRTAIGIDINEEHCRIAAGVGHGKHKPGQQTLAL